MVRAIAIAASPSRASSFTFPPSKMKVTMVAELVIQPGQALARKVSTAKTSPPVAPVAAEPGQGGLAGGQGVALDLHVDEELGHHPEHGRPQEHERDLGGDVGPEDELARGQPDPGRDHPRAEDLAQG